MFWPPSLLFSLSGLLEQDFTFSFPPRISIVFRTIQDKDLAKTPNLEDYQSYFRNVHICQFPERFPVRQNWLHIIQYVLTERDKETQLTMKMTEMALLFISEALCVESESVTYETAG